MGPGGNHLATRITRTHYRQFWQPALIDQNTHERWLALGGGSLMTRIRTRLRELLAQEPPFELDPATAARLAELGTTTPAVSVSLVSAQSRESS